MIIVEYLPSEPSRLWDWCLQMGVEHAICKCAPELTGINAPDDLDALRVIQQRFANHGMTLHGLEGDQFDMRRIKLGLPGRDDDLERYRRMLRNMGELGIPLLCYNFMAGIGWHRSEASASTRGGALTTRFDLNDVPDELTDAGEVSAERMWENYEYFLNAVLPVAEEAGVRMALHPDDPPLPELRGIARILSSPDGIGHALSLNDSPSHGLTFCQANFKLMGGELESMIRRFGNANRIFFIHFRDVRGTAECFDETFHDDGPTDMPEMMRRYHEIGFDGPVRVDHVPTLTGERNEKPGYGKFGRLFAIGYLKGILDTLAIPNN